MSSSHDAHAALETFRTAVASAEASFAALRGLSASVEGVEGIVETLIGHLKAGDSLLVPLLSTAPRAASTAHTAVNVGILSLRIGMELQYAHPELSQLGLVALLHDVGRTGIRALGPAYAQVMDLVAQTHERVSGRGADGGRGVPVHEHAQIVALAVTYDSLSRQQPKGPRAWPPEAVKEILRRERARFPDAILKALIHISVTFPVGGFVRLNSGEVACVIAKNDGLPLRPVVAVAARRGRQPAEPRLIDLREHPFLYIGEFLGYEAPE